MARFCLHAGKKSRVIGAQVVELSGLPCVLMRQVPYMSGVAPYVANLFDADVQGQISRIYSVMTTRKLHGVVMPR